MVKHWNGQACQHSWHHKLENWSIAKPPQLLKLQLADCRDLASFQFQATWLSLKPCPSIAPLVGSSRQVLWQERKNLDKYGMNLSAAALSGNGHRVIHNNQRPLCFSIYDLTRHKWICESQQEMRIESFHHVAYQVSCVQQLADETFFECRTSAVCTIKPW